MSKLYRYQWTGKKTRWIYRLDIIPGGDAELGTPTVYELPPGSLKVKKIKLGFEKYPFGMQLVSTMDIDWDFNMVPNTADYNDLLDAVTNNDALCSENVPPAGVYTYFPARTIYKLQCKYVGQDDTDIFRPFFTGLQSKPAKYDYSNAPDTPSVTINDINRCAVEFVTFNWLKYLLSDGPFEARRQILESLLVAPGSGGDYNRVIGHYNGDIEGGFWFYQLSAFWDYLELFAQTVYRKFLRDSSLTYTLNHPKTKYFKQDYTGAGTWTTALNWTELYMFVADASSNVYAGSTIYAGLFCENDSKGLLAKFKNSIWDFLSDFYSDSLTKTILYPNGEIAAHNIYEYTSTINLDKHKIEKKRKISPGENAGKTFTASLHEKIDQDIDKFEQTDYGSINDVGITLPILFNTVPSACPYFWKNDVASQWKSPPTDEDYFHTNYPSLMRINTNPSLAHMYSLYYFDKPSMIVSSSDDVALRVHEHCVTPLAAGKDTDDLTAVRIATAVNWYVLTKDQWEPSTQNILDMQRQNSKGRIQSLALSDLFKGDKLVNMEFEIEFYEYTEFLSGGSVGFPWGQDGFNILFNFDVATINPRVDMPTEWVLLNSDLDMDEEIAKATLQTKVI